MKKFGFTLAEILITLGIIGVISALMAPTITNIMPDKDKIIMLRVYNNLNSITQSLLGDPTLYYPKINEYTGEGEVFGLAAPVGNHSATTRYPNLVVENLGRNGGSSTNFKCDNGASCYIKCSGYDSITCDFRITMTYKDRSSHCSFSSTCDRPNRFDFEIDNFGTIRPVDKLSKAYLMNPLHTNQRKLDYEKASSL